MREAFQTGQVKAYLLYNTNFCGGKITQLLGFFPLPVVAQRISNILRGELFVLCINISQKKIAGKAV